jgi:hypothetical protein|tara:strand:+ start:161 stop:604 length:444 start_codon:yes stop_codon:yes gene_type:complete
MNRFLIGVFFFLILIMFGIYNSLEYDKHRKYPPLSDAISEPSAYADKKMVIMGYEVKDVQDNSFIVEIANQQVTIVNAPTVNVGDRVEVLGTLKPDYQFLAEKTIVSTKWNHYLIYIRSIIAIPLVLFLFFRKWRFDFNYLRFRESE